MYGLRGFGRGVSGGAVDDGISRGFCGCGMTLVAGNMGLEVMARRSSRSCSYVFAFSIVTSETLIAGLSLAVVSTIMELRSDSSFEISALVIPVFPLVSTGLNWGCGGTVGSGGISPREDMNSSRLVGRFRRTDRTVFSSIV
jgi:hypothetical protein